jgi:hypothetical protein
MKFEEWKFLNETCLPIIYKDVSFPVVVEIPMVTWHIAGKYRNGGKDSTASVSNPHNHRHFGS